MWIKTQKGQLINLDKVDFVYIQSTPTEHSVDAAFNGRANHKTIGSFKHKTEAQDFINFIQEVLGKNCLNIEEYYREGW